MFPLFLPGFPKWSISSYATLIANLLMLEYVDKECLLKGHSLQKIDIQSLLLARQCCCNQESQRSDFKIVTHAKMYVMFSPPNKNDLLLAAVSSRQSLLTTLERFIGARPYIIIKGTLSNSEFRCETAALKFSMKNDDVAN